MIFYQLVQIIAVLLTGLVAGLFYSYSCSVTGGLSKLSDKEYLLAFQSINNVILNPWFFTSFMGCIVVLPLATWGTYNTANNFSFWLLLLATTIYITGVFGVTLVGNVPLNNMLKDLDLSTTSSQELFSLRQKFEIPWNKRNLIRTMAATLSFLFTILSLLRIQS